ncbi:M20/M25/M40 family metallo-hydrolase [Paenibacillus sp. OV219]|uniref:M20/M25/M40 family metallo-hydrolase n=1 Tax=Paenibacillus sp. OV219 TaxID=1884377 RepID=UPI0008B05446|nr:M20/M25/M40 family metallo-hydrolase [Paenibacillus sp. OV219]SEN29186.1 Acetylornithine deacetylase/Succinyl-diaminopimelate desuccinylase [Paenibacillus sp. OV219]
MKAAHIKLEAWIEKHEHEMIALLQRLVQMPSDNPKGDCLAIAELVFNELSALGFAPRMDVVPHEDVRAAGMIAVSNVVADTRLGEGQGLVIVLNAHGDVVPPGDGWSCDPYGGMIEAGKLFGRGAAVSKSDIAVYTYAVMALRDSGVWEAQQQQQQHQQPGGTLALAFTFDEETGGELGPKRLLEQGTIKPDYAIVAGFTHAAVTSHNGCLHLEVSLKGRSAHAAIPHTGADALEAMTEVLMELYDYRAELGQRHSGVIGIESPTLVVGLIQGGINTNVVPDRCTIRLDRRIIPEENPELAEQELRELIARTAARFPQIELDVHRVLLARPFCEVEGTEQLLCALRPNWSAVMGGVEMPVVGVPLYADARHFTEAGVPTVMFGAGPRTLEEANGHRADEHVQIRDLTLAVRILSFMLYDLLNDATFLAENDK